MRSSCSVSSTLIENVISSWLLVQAMIVSTLGETVKHSNAISPTETERINANGSLGSSWIVKAMFVRQQ